VEWVVSFTAQQFYPPRKEPPVPIGLEVRKIFIFLRHFASGMGRMSIPSFIYGSISERISVNGFCSSFVPKFLVKLESESHKWSLLCFKPNSFSRDDPRHWWTFLVNLNTLKDSVMYSSLTVQLNLASAAHCLYLWGINTFTIKYLGLSEQRWQTQEKGNIQRGHIPTDDHDILFVLMFLFYFCLEHIWNIK